MHVDSKFIYAFLCLVSNDFKYPGPYPLMIQMSEQMKLTMLFFNKDKRYYKSMSIYLRKIWLQIYDKVRSGQKNVS